MELASTGKDPKEVVDQSEGHKKKEGGESAQSNTNNQSNL